MRQKEVVDSGQRESSKVLEGKRWERGSVYLKILRLGVVYLQKHHKCR